jgi:hypothetical protein
MMGRNCESACNGIVERWPHTSRRLRRRPAQTATAKGEQPPRKDASQKTSRLTPPAHRGTISRLPSLYTREEPSLDERSLRRRTNVIARPIGVHARDMLRIVIVATATLADFGANAIGSIPVSSTAKRTNIRSNH